MSEVLLASDFEKAKREVYLIGYDRQVEGSKKEAEEVAVELRKAGQFPIVYPIGLKIDHMGT